MPKPQADEQQVKMALAQLLSTPPEPIIELLERLEIPWAKTDIDGELSLVIKWKDLREGEKRNQEQGPFINKVMTKIREGVEGKTDDEDIFQ